MAGIGLVQGIRRRKTSGDAARPVRSAGARATFVQFLGIKKLGFPDRVTQDVFSQMTSERQVLVEQLQREGEAEIPADGITPKLAPEKLGTGGVHDVGNDAIFAFCMTAALKADKAAVDKVEAALIESMGKEFPGSFALWHFRSTIDAPVTLEEKQATTRLLLASGANIHEINSIRKHISRIKGGQLARLASPARVESLMLSDVIGDNLDVIGSGPTAPDASTFAGALGLLDRYGIRERVPASVRERIEQGAAGAIPETPKPDDPVFARVRNTIVGSNRLALAAAAARARALGYRTLVLSSEIQGEAREIARMHAAIASEMARTGHPMKPPACIITGGETTVTLRGDGLGGRAQEFALAAAIDIAGLENVVVTAAIINVPESQALRVILASVGLVAVNDNGVTKINFVSTLPNFSVALGKAPSALGITDASGAQGDTTKALQVGSGGTADISTVSGAQAAVTAISNAVSALGSAQAGIGKGENQLNYAVSLAQSQITNLSAAESQIRDANVAQQAANLSKAQVLSQASIAAMAQANSAPQAVLSLLRG